MQLNAHNQPSDQDMTLARRVGCGGSYSKISANLFGCATARNKGTCDNRLNIRRDDLEAIILDGLKSRLKAPELFKAFADAFIAEFNRLRGEEGHKREAVRSEFDKITRQFDRLVEAIANGADALALNARLKFLEERQQQVSQDLDAGTEKSEPLIHPNLAELYRRKVADLADAIHAPENRDEAFEVIRSLIDRVVLTPTEDALRIDLEGDLAGILSLCDSSKKPAASVEARAEQIKVVAGARNRRYLHLDFVRL